MDPDVLTFARQEFAKADPERMAGLSGSVYVPGRKAIRLRYLNADYEVSFPNGEIATVQGEIAVVQPGNQPGKLPKDGELNKDEETLLLQYLSQAIGVPTAGRWISYAELPHGMLHDAPFRIEAIRPLEQVFDQRPQQLIRAARQLGGQEIKLTGDASVVIPVLPRILMAVSLWVGDEEFPARVNMLFDAAVPWYLSTASLYVLGANLSLHLRQQQETVRKE